MEFNKTIQVIKNMKNTLLTLLVIFNICCKTDNHLNSYSVNIKYQYIIFKTNEDKSYNIYVENFFKIKNNTTDTLTIPISDFERNLRIAYKNDSPKPFTFMSESDLTIAPLDSIDLNCAVDLQKKVDKIPMKVNAKDYRVYDNLSNKFLSQDYYYEIIRTTEFGVFKHKYLE